MKFAQDLKIIWQWLKPFKKKLVVFGILATIASAISAFIPYLYGQLVDMVLVRENVQLIFIILGGWLVLSLIADKLGRYNDHRGGITAMDAETRLNRKISVHVLTLPLSFLHKNKIGEVARKINHAGNHLEQITWIVFESLPKFITVIIVLIFLLSINYWLAIALFVILVVYITATMVKTKPIIEANKPMNKSFEKAYGDIWDMIYNTQVVKSNANIEHENKRAKRNFGDALKKFAVFNKKWVEMSSWQQVIFAFGFVGLFGFALLLLYQGQITAGNLVTFIGYVALVFAPFATLANSYRQFRRGVDSIKRANNIYNEKPESYFRRGNDVIERIEGKVEFKNLSFSYDQGKQVLNNISFKSKPGEVVALVGKTGAGKSTFVDLVSGYFLPTKGEILIDGHNLVDLDINEYRKHIAYVPQEVSLFNDTVNNNIKYGKLKATRKEIMAASKAANADEFIKKLPKGYDTIVGERGVKLSVGQKQRVAIARAILRSPEILILDEATSSLDSVTERLVQEALERLISGRTTFVIAHRLSTITKADRILVIEDGRIVEIGTHRSLLAKKQGHYKKLYQTQTLFSDIG